MERERARRRAVAQAGLDYQQARLDRLEALLRDPASWRWLAVHFRQARDDAGDRGLEEWWVAADRLHRGSVDVLRLLGEPLPPELASD